MRRRGRSVIAAPIVAGINQTNILMRSAPPFKVARLQGRRAGRVARLERRNLFGFFAIKMQVLACAQDLLGGQEGAADKLGRLP